MNEAKEALKSLKMKMGGSSTSQRGVHMQQADRNTVGNNDNYRKAFKPSLDNDFGVSNTYSGHQNGTVITSNKPKVTMTKKPIGNVHSHMGNNRSLVPSDDSRLAFSQEKKSFEYISFNPLSVDPYPNDEEDDNGERIECQGCGRKFVPEAYAKHGKVCKKVFQTKRKAFDVKKQRILDSEHAAILRQKEFEEKKKGKVGMGLNNNNNKNIPTKKSKWKKQSEEFRAIMKANQGSKKFVYSSNEE